MNIQKVASSHSIWISCRRPHSPWAHVKVFSLISWCLLSLSLSSRMDSVNLTSHCCRNFGPSTSRFKISARWYRKMTIHRRTHRHRPTPTSTRLSRTRTTGRWRISVDRHRWAVRICGRLRNPCREWKLRHPHHQSSLEIQKCSNHSRFE